MRAGLPILLAALLAACGPGPARSQGQLRPEDTRAPNASGQHPAFAGQTRAPALRAKVAFKVQVVARGLDHPWGLVFLPDGRMLVSERVGRLRIVSREGTISAPATGVPSVVTGQQAGVFDVALDPAFVRSRLIYLAFQEPRQGGLSGLSVARARLAESGGRPALKGLQVIFRAVPAMSPKANLGGRLAWAPDGTLFVTVGDRFVPEGQRRAQTLDNDLGKVVRIAADGSIPRDNPFVGHGGARPEIWSIGHRNIEAAAINPWTRQLWTVEHGPRGGDELNIPLAGRNYGWPVISYGEDYSGRPIGRGLTQQPGMEQPVYYWDPVIAPSGMAFYDAALLPGWKGSLFIGSLGSEQLTRLTLKGDRVVGEEWLLKERGDRIRDVAAGPDGALWLLTDAADGKLLRLSPP